MDYSQSQVSSLLYWTLTLASAFLCAKLGVSSSPRQDHANYLASWLEVLKKDKRAIFYAARQATVAMEYLNNLTKE